MLPKSRMLGSFEVSCDLPRPRPILQTIWWPSAKRAKYCRRRWRQRSTIFRTCEHTLAPHTLPRPLHSARYRYRHVHLTSPLSEWRLSIMTCVNYDVCQYCAAIAERSVYARHDYLLTFISFSFIFYSLLLRHD